MDTGYPPWFKAFCRPDADRGAALSEGLKAALLTFETVTTGPHRHLQVRGERPARPQPGETVLIAHYDRVAGSPGANDNGASVLALVDYLRRPRRGAALRVVFTDGEELGPHPVPSRQGSYGLATLWGPLPGLFPVVLDMTGIGDTLVLGHLAEQLIRQVRPEPVPTAADDYARLRLKARRWLAACGAGDTVEVDTPFSDDLGLFLAGLPAVQISLLPRKEALAYRRGGVLPPAWQTMHSPDDGLETLWPASRTLMAQVLDKLEALPR